MPIRKYRDVSEMSDTWYAPGSPSLVDAIRRVWSFASRTCPLTFPSGVHKHRSFAEADALRAEWEHQNFVRHQARLRAAAARRDER